MNINWKTRFTNKTFLIAISSAVVVLAQQLGLNIFPNNWSEILNTILTIFILLGIVIDPSTAGISDPKVSNDKPIQENKESQY
jgi:phi LC3 family holin